MKNLHCPVKKRTDIAKIAICTTCFAIVFFIIFAMLHHIFSNGFPLLSFDFIAGFNGLLPIIINTLYVCFLSLFIALPISFAAAAYLAFYAKSKRFIRFVNFMVDSLAGIPSIIFGILGYQFFVITLGLGFSIFAGTLTLAICVLPILIKTTTAAFSSVSNTLKNAGLGMGLSKIFVIRKLILPRAIPMISVGIMLAIARIIGETAALWYTVGIGSTDMPEGIFGHIFAPGRTLSLHLYQATINPSYNAHTPHATAIILVLTILAINLIISKILNRIYAKRSKRHD